MFNAAGELLASDPAPAAAKSATLSRATARQVYAVPPAVRPFTAAERAALTGAEK